MGVGCSKCRSSRRSSCNSSCAPSERPGTARRRSEAAEEKSLPEETAEWEEERREAMNRLREEFKLQPRLFLISQILLTVQFFKNFQRDSQRMYQLKHDKEDEINKALQKDKKSVIYLGSPYEVIGESMEYHRSDNDEPSLGHDLDYLMVHDNVSVRSRLDEEDPTDDRQYKFVIQETGHEGFVRLSQVGRPTPPGSRGRAASAGFPDDPPAPATVVLERQRRRAARQRTPKSRGGHPAQTSRRSPARNGLPPDEKDETEQRLSGQIASEEGNTESKTGYDDSERLRAEKDSLAQQQGDLIQHTNNNSGKGQAFMNQLRKKVKGDTKASVDLSDDEIQNAAHSTNEDYPLADDIFEGNPVGDKSTGESRSGAPDPGLTETDRGKARSPSQDQASSPASLQPSPPHPVMTAPATTGKSQPYASHPFPNGQVMPGYFGFHIFPGPWATNPYQINSGELSSLPEHSQSLQIPEDGPQYSQYPGYPPPLFIPQPYPQMGGWPAGPLAHYPPGYFPNGFPIGGYPGYASPPMFSQEGAPEGEPREDITESKKGREEATNSGTSRTRKSSTINGLLKPPTERRRRRRRRNSFGSSLSDPENPRQASSTGSRNSILTVQDSTTTSTDEEYDTPGHLPRHCFRKMLVRIDEDDEPRLEKFRFLSAEIFLNHFTDSFHHLARMMAQEVWLHQGGRSYLRGPAINCREELRGSAGLYANVRVIPTLLVDSWPAEMTLGWRFRSRNELLDERRKVRFVWPPKRVIDSICDEVGCSLVPQGSENVDGKGLEWEVCFQQAEIKLISSLDLLHVHCWAIAKLFFMHFLADFGCIKEQHIRHLMFWQFEKNFRDWRLESLGRPFDEFLTRLGQRIQERKLPHYFITKRNLLDTRAENSMAGAQQKIQRVMENLLPNMIILMSRLRVREEAFPSFDWAALYENLRMTETAIMKKLVPELSQTPNEDHRDSLFFNPGMTVREEDDDEGDIWGASRRQKMEQRYLSMLKSQRVQNMRPTRRVSAAPVRRNTVLPTFADANVRLHVLTPDFWPRSEAVLLLFIEHFIQMSDRLLQYGSTETAVTYIDHTMNLCTLLAEQGRTEEVNPYRERLLKLQDRVAAELGASHSPETHEVDPDLLVLDREGPQQDNWTVGPAGGRKIRRNFNTSVRENGEDGSNDQHASGGIQLRADVHSDNPINKRHNDGLLSNIPNGDVRHESFFTGDALSGGVRVNPLAAMTENESPSLQNANGSQDGKNTPQDHIEDPRNSKTGSLSSEHHAGSLTDVKAYETHAFIEYEMSSAAYPGDTGNPDTTETVKEDEGTSSSQGSDNVSTAQDKWGSDDSLLTPSDNVFEKPSQMQFAQAHSHSGSVKIEKSKGQAADARLQDEDADQECEDTAC